MLFNPSWQPADTKPATIFSLDALIAWLETMPATEHYQAALPDKCLLGQYASAVGVKDVSGWSCDVSLHDGLFRFVAFGPKANGPWTFGDALDRARSTQHKAAA